MWNDTAATRRLGIRYPIVQGPFGGGLSSARLVAAVSNAGGLGSFGAQGLPPSRINEVVRDIRARTGAPFAVNLWVSTDDADARAVTRERYDAALQTLAPYFAELHVEPPRFPLPPSPAFDEQMAGLLDARPPVFSFVFGIPPERVLEQCRGRSIVTMGTATTVDEAVALERAGVDIVVASAFEAGGHRPSFLRSPEASLTGLFSLVPQVSDAVDIPVSAAGGIADARGVAAALALGADGVQIGTAFLACEESNAPPAHRNALLGPRSGDTVLTRAFSGRLARGLRNTVADALDARTESRLPYPLQGRLVGALREEAIRIGRTDLIAMWGGQSAPLLRHRRAAALFDDLITTTERILAHPTHVALGSPLRGGGAAVDT
ncbi:MAG TPA: nitronate monooxygenase [Vicinamibacterales bacterium]|nr:nitronate monooxygenase [Vicinamibacterales bacterium]